MQVQSYELSLVGNETGPPVFKTVFMFDSTEHEISSAHENKNDEK